MSKLGNESAGFSRGNTFVSRDPSYWEDQMDLCLQGSFLHGFATTPPPPPQIKHHTNDTQVISQTDCKRWGGGGVG